MVRKNLLAEGLSILIGIALFTLVINLAGLGNIIASVRNFSPQYFGLFLLASFSLWVASTFRWKVVLDSEGVSVPFWELLRYKLMVFSINYLTPVARSGGEPFKIMLLRKQRIKTSKSLASIVLDNFIGLGFDAVLGGIFLIVFFFSSSVLPRDFRMLLLGAGIVTVLLVLLGYLVLTRRRGVFTSALAVTGVLTRIGKQRFFVSLKAMVKSAESSIRTMLTRKPRKVFLVCVYAALSWPLAIAQYKFALLMLGVDASISQIIICIAVMTFTSILPIPGSLGVQEAGQFSVFKILTGNPHLGIALSLIIRLKDVIFLNISFFLLSMEGLSIASIINKRVQRVLANGKRKSPKSAAK